MGWKWHPAEGGRVSHGMAFDSPLPEKGAELRHQLPVTIVLIRHRAPTVAA